MFFKKGQTKIVTLMIAIAVFVLAIGLAFPVQETVGEARIDMNCSNASTDLGDYVEGSCVLVDITPFLFIGGLLGLVAVIIGARIAFAR